MSEENKLIPKKVEGLPHTKEYSHDQIMQMAEIYQKSGLLPSHLKSKEAAYIAMQWAVSIQISPFMLKDIYVIDNIPTIKTELAIAMVEQSGYCDNIEQSFTGTPFEDSYTAVVKVKRKGRKEHISKFSVADAKRAGLWGKRTVNNKPTAWVSYPSRMLLYRAMGFALRDIFPDVLRGSVTTEEAQDFSQYEVVKDESTSSEIKVEVRKKPDAKYGKPKMTDNLTDLPPDENDNSGIQDAEIIK